MGAKRSISLWITAEYYSTLSSCILSVGLWASTWKILSFSPIKCSYFHTNHSFHEPISQKTIAHQHFICQLRSWWLRFRSWDFFLFRYCWYPCWRYEFCFGCFWRFGTGESCYVFAFIGWGFMCKWIRFAWSMGSRIVPQWVQLYFSSCFWFRPATFWSDRVWTVFRRFIFYARWVQSLWNKDSY